MGHAKRGGERVLESRHLIALFLGVVLLCCVFFTLGYVMGKTQYGNTPVEAAAAPKALHPDAHSAKVAQPKPSASTEWDFYTEKKTTDVPLRSRPGSPPRPHSSAAAANSGDANHGWIEDPVSASAKPVSNVTPAKNPPSAPAAKAPSHSTLKSAAPTRSSKPAPGRREPIPTRFRAPHISRSAVVLQVTAVRRQSDALALADKLQRRGFPAFVVSSARGGFYRVEVGPFDTKSIGEQAKKSLQREGFKPIYRR